ncbi:radical SAM protein [Chitinispirillales bacterium ANBcel5]|uniref:radical SAM protein n=1 Tax=Cellulosispirillum alkaliphilum TaxID=3039283 RepID=UPI002A55EAC6|nr:radical SAM protein [Chitinispirillales bacterium ANBcel5]
MKPILLHYYITNRCNARCTFCDIWQQLPKTDAKSSEVFLNLEHARKAGCKFVDFTGGEPLLHPLLPDFLSYAKKLGYITSVTTNCTIFEKKVDNLRGKIDLLHFSLDADSAEQHNKIRGCDSFDSVLSSIDVALDKGLIPDILFTYTQENLEFFEGVYRLAREKKVMIILDPVFAIESADQLDSKIHQKAVQFSKRRGVYLNKAHIVLRQRGGNRIEAPRCRAVSSTVVLLPDNTMALPCYHHREELVPVDGDLFNRLSGQRRRRAKENEGTYSFCEGCHINCYMDPSYQYRFDRYFRVSITSKLKYAWDKYFHFKRPLP